MITIAWYVLKVIICSGILCGYYYAALRNKLFHRWNRFYLLACVVLSLTVPMMKIHIFQTGDAQPGTVVRMLSTLNSGDDIVMEYGRNNGLQLSSENVITSTYLLISLVLLSILMLALRRISRLKKEYPCTSLHGIRFIATNAKGTPFSFFNSIFWNNAIDLHSRQGHQIFNHEIAHVKEKHSWDKVFMNTVLVFFWINPFFWLMQKELGMIHEFIADKEALEDHDINAFAEMVLQTVYPGRHFSITSNFFNSPLKRRLTMFTKNKNPKVSYASRLLVLPLAAIVFFAFTLKMKTITPAVHFAGKKITVIIDAGHGGSDDGVIENNVKEKDLNLSIAKEIKEINKNENLNIILSRSGDELMTPRERTSFAEANKADLFISIHIDAKNGDNTTHSVNKNTESGLIIFIPKDDNGYMKESRLLGSAIAASFKNNYELPVNDYLQQRQLGIWVLKANPCPSVLIEAGFLTTQTDFDYLTKLGNQQTIAEDILEGVEAYATQKIQDSPGAAAYLSPDTVPIASRNKSSEQPLYVVDGKIVTAAEGNTIDPKEIDRVDVLKGKSATAKYGDMAKNGAVEITRKNMVVAEAAVSSKQLNHKASPLYMLDGKEISQTDVDHLNKENIESITVLKGNQAIAKYGPRGKNGVVEIATKGIDPKPTGTKPDKQLPGA
jgi:TonB-dependent SusC/RagA subfamily outer membrane receptor